MTVHPGPCFLFALERLTFGVTGGPKDLHCFLPSLEHPMAVTFSWRSSTPFAWLDMPLGLPLAFAHLLLPFPISGVITGQRRGGVLVRSTAVAVGGLGTNIGFRTLSLVPLAFASIVLGTLLFFSSLRAWIF